MLYYCIRLFQPKLISGFSGAIFDSAMEVVWDVLPITYILYSNYIVLRRVPKFKQR